MDAYPSSKNNNQIIWTLTQVHRTITRSYGRLLKFK